MVIIKSAKRALDILSLFTQTNSALGVSDISDALQLNKATVARLMATLELSGFIKRTRKSGRKYCLGHKIGELIRVYLPSLDFKELARPYLEDLHQTTNEMVSISIRKEDKRCFLDWIESPKPVRYVVEVDNSHGPLHAGAPGKAILAYLPIDEIENIIDRTGLHRYTDFTITNKQELLKDLKQIRESGVAISKGEHTDHVSTIAAPVRNFTGNVIASLCISWLTIDADEKKEMQYVALIKKAAKALSMQLGYYAYQNPLTTSEGIHIK